MALEPSASLPDQWLAHSWHRLFLGWLFCSGDLFPYFTHHWSLAQTWDNVSVLLGGVSNQDQVNASSYFLIKRVYVHYFCIAQVFILHYDLWKPLGHMYIGFMQEFTTWSWRVQNEISTHYQWSHNYSGQCSSTTLKPPESIQRSFLLWTHSFYMIFI